MREREKKNRREKKDDLTGPVVPDEDRQRKREMKNIREIKDDLTGPVVPDEDADTNADGGNEGEGGQVQEEEHRLRYVYITALL